MPVLATSAGKPLGARIACLDWAALTDGLDKRGYATTGPLLTAAECAGLIELYSRDNVFRSRIVMARHGYGQGEYQYFAYPLPLLVSDVRTTCYEHLVPLANRWAEAMKLETRYPARHGEMIARCHEAGQMRPTPLILKYGTDDYNCLHQDLYGEHLFPIQVAFLLSRPQSDFDGGEFVLVEQRARMQSRPEVVPLVQGEAVMFAVNQRPVQEKNGPYRVTMRHGVSRIRSGNRYTMGVIFHDAT
ncbi:MAG: 2OG-Fe(II) oxygenase [Candidatus Sericytochromatia bacterium]|nr:2OG-Fe(II) oxygenase [Candidatus Sericytochromatia bacterium]